MKLGLKYLHSNIFKLILFFNSVYDGDTIHIYILIYLN